MREIIPHRLWTGHARDARNLQMLHEQYIVAVVDLAAEEEPCKLSRDLIYCRFPLVDGGDNERERLLLAIRLTILLLREAVPTLVACSAGMSRSPAVAAAALSIVDGMHINDALLQVTGGHAHDISPKLWEEVRMAVRELEST